MIGTLRRNPERFVLPVHKQKELRQRRSEL